MSRMLDILQKFLNLHNFSYVRLDGGIKVSQRQYIVDQFNNNQKILCFVSSTRCGGIGLNLTAASSVIFYDTDWNPAMDLQAQDRCHRIGQTRTVHIYRLISERTIEENIYKKSVFKKELEAMITKAGFNPQNFVRSLNQFVSDENLILSKNIRSQVAYKGLSLKSVKNMLKDEDDDDQQFCKHAKGIQEVLEKVQDKEDYQAYQQMKDEIQQDSQEFNEDVQIKVQEQDNDDDDDDGQIDKINELEEDQQGKEKVSQEIKQASVVQQQAKINTQQLNIKRGQLFNWNEDSSILPIAKLALNFVQKSYPYETFEVMRKMQDDWKKQKEEKSQHFSSTNKNQDFGRDQNDFTGILKTQIDEKVHDQRVWSIGQYISGLRDLQQYYEVGTF